MRKEQQRHDISEKMWKLPELHLPEQRGQWGGIAQDTGGSLLGYFGSYAQEHRGGIYHCVTENGILYISVFVNGVTRKSGKSRLKHRLMNLILNE